MGALPILYAGTDPELPGGSYIGPDGPGEMRGYPTVVQPSDMAKDPEPASHLWTISETLTGVHYDLRVPAVA